MKVENMISRKGNSIANQFTVEADNGDTFFQSYKSIIAVKRGNPVEDTHNYIELDEKYWNYSVTTSKYRSIFLNESTIETRAKIKSGEYKLTNLNKDYSKMNKNQLENEFLTGSYKLGEIL